jgi:hypothetical protein
VIRIGTTAGCGYSASDCFNQPLVLPPSVRHFKVGNAYTYPLILPEGIISVNIGHGFNHPLVIPASTRRLKVGSSFNQPLILPHGMEDFKMSHAFDDSGDVVRGMKIGGSFEDPNQFPAGYFHDPIFQHSIGTLPKTLKRLQLCIDVPLELPEGLEELIITAKTYSHHLKLANSIERLSIKSDFTQELCLSRNLRFLDMEGSSFNKPIALPHGVEYAEFGFNFDQRVTLPTTIKWVAFGSAFDHPVRIPKGCVYVKVPQTYQHSLALPDGCHLEKQAVYCEDDEECSDDEESESECDCSDDEVEEDGNNSEVDMS